MIHVTAKNNKRAFSKEENAGQKISLSRKQ